MEAGRNGPSFQPVPLHVGKVKKLTGESVTISAEEKKEIINTIADANGGRLPLVLGIGGNNTAQVVSEIKNTDLSQITALLSVAPC